MSEDWTKDETPEERARRQSGINSSDDDLPRNRNAESPPLSVGPNDPSGTERARRAQEPPAEPPPRRRNVGEQPSRRPKGGKGDEGKR
jgi:hypothetical protein